MCDGAPLPWRWLNICLLMGRGEWIPCVAWLVCAAFALSVKLSLFQPMSFLTFNCLILYPIPWGGEVDCRVSEWVAVWCLVDMGLSRDNSQGCHNTDKCWCLGITTQRVLVQCGDAWKRAKCQQQLSCISTESSEGPSSLWRQWLQQRHVFRGNHAALMSCSLNGTRLNPVLSRTIAVNAGQAETESTVKLALENIYLTQICFSFAANKNAWSAQSVWKCTISNDS